MKRKGRYRGIKVILLLRDEYYKDRWLPVTDKIYTQVSKKPRRIKDNDSPAITLREHSDMKVQYIFGLKAQHRKYVRKLNKMI